MSGDFRVKVSTGMEVGMGVVRPGSPAFLELARSVRGLELQREGDLITIFGEADSYYQKQLVQEAAKVEYPGWGLFSFHRGN